MCLEGLQQAHAVLPLPGRVQAVQRQALLVPRAAQAVGELHASGPELARRRRRGGCWQGLHAGAAGQLGARGVGQQRCQVQVPKGGVSLRQGLRGPSGDAGFQCGLRFKGRWSFVLARGRRFGRGGRDRNLQAGLDTQVGQRATDGELDSQRQGGGQGGRLGGRSGQAGLHGCVQSGVQSQRGISLQRRCAFVQAVGHAGVGDGHAVGQAVKPIAPGDVGG